MKLDKVVAVRTKKTVYRDQDYAIKVFSEDYKKSDILNEALNQARVEETGLYIPKIIEVTKVDGKWAIVSEFIEGKTLHELMEKILISRMITLSFLSISRWRYTLKARRS